MKLYYKYWLVVILSLWVLQLSGQSSTLTIKENFTNTPLTDVLSLLKNKYHLKLAYDNAAVANVMVNQSVNQLSLDQALRQIFSNTTLTYQIIGSSQGAHPKG